MIARTAAQLATLVATLVAGGVATPSPAHAEEPKGGDAAAASSVSLDLELHRFTLGNGLRVVVNENHDAPTVSVCVTYDVGARNEQEGRTGFAHLFEHMMFQGTRNVPKGGHFQMIRGRGGSVNGTTSSDRTNYFETLPASELELALWLEAERMGSLAVVAENFENQRKVVQEEYRMRYANRAYGLGGIRLRQLVYQGYWPYEHATIGSMDDLDAAELSWVRAFYKKYYAPNNAVLAISGDVDPETARQLVEKHFGDLKHRNTPAYSPPEKFPTQTSERLSVITDENAKTPAAYYGWQIPPAHTEEHYALELATFVLARGESSRLYQSLVIERATAQWVRAGTHGSRGPDMFVVALQSAPKSHLDRAQEALDGEIKRLRFLGPSESELAKAKAQKRFEFLRALQTNQGAAIWLSQHELYWGDASDLLRELDRYDAVTRDDVKKAANRYLLEHRRSITEIYPPGWVKDEPPDVIRRTHIVSKGDTLIGIAARYGSTVYKITTANNINAKSTLHPGQKLIVPVLGKLPTNGSGGASGGGGTKKPDAPKHVTHTVKKGDNLSVIAHKYGTSVDSIARYNGLDAKKPLQIGKTLTIPLPPPSSSSAAPATKKAGKASAPASKKKIKPVPRSKKPPAKSKSSAPTKSKSTAPSSTKGKK